VGHGAHNGLANDGKERSGHAISVKKKAGMQRSTARIYPQGLPSI
jgi:hypothetical protein